MQILICGNYRDGNLAINGQTIKTRAFTDAIVKAFGEERVQVLDTSRVFRNPLGFYAAARAQVAQCTHVIVLPGPRAVHVLLPLFAHWRRRFGNDVRYVVIGGFLPSFLRKHPRLRRACAQIDGVYVETQSMYGQIRQLGLVNVHVLPNFRSFNLHMARDYKPVGIPLSAVFCARVFKEKGIEEAVAAVDRINEIADATMVQLDVYGPVEESYAKRFEQLVARSPTTRYMGTLEPSILHTALQRYDVMLFPTYYSDEGFPGTIVDAYIAGVPVLASRWAYNTELIELGRTGAICSPHSVEDLTKALMQFVAAPQLLTEMRTHCIARARDYHVDRVMGAFLRDLAATG